MEFKNKIQKQISTSNFQRLLVKRPTANPFYVQAYVQYGKARLGGISLSLFGTIFSSVLLAQQVLAAETLSSTSLKIAKISAATSATDSTPQRESGGERVNRSPQDDPTESSTSSQSHMLFGRVDDFLTPGGPAFPTFFGTAQKDDEGEHITGWPLDISGTWHGETEVKACLTTDDCTKWNPGFAQNWNEQQGRKGPGFLTFEKKGNSTYILRGRSVFAVPVRESKDTYNEIIGKFLDPTKEQIAAIDKAIEPLMSPITEDYGKKHSRKTEVMGGGITIHVDSEQSKRRRLSNNTWESDSVSKRTVHFPAPRPAETMYTEGVFTLTKNDDGTLDWQSAGARYSADKKLLCSSVIAGHFSRGSTEMPDGRDLSINLVPSSAGVTINATGALGTQCSVLIPGAKIKPQNFQFLFGPGSGR
jgi:hypothetical protein